MPTAQQIADAALAPQEGDELLIEAICRAFMRINMPNSDPDEVTRHGPLWEGYKDAALEHLAVIRIIAQEIP
jgi:hypothetical protein